MRSSRDRPLNVIAIETSGLIGSIALLKSGRPAEERLFGEGLQHARDLVPALAALLDSHGLRTKDVDLYSVATGPGSYTGLRVGVVTARALAYSSGKQVVGVPTMDTLVRNIARDARFACTVIDAKRGEIYMRLFRREEAWAAASQVRVASPEEAAESIPQEAVLVGDALAEYGEFFRTRGLRLAPQELWRPRASAVAELGVRLFTERGADDVHTLVPVYVRRPAAEEKKLRAN